MCFSYSLCLFIVVYLCFVWCDVVEESSEKPLSDEKLIQRSYKSCKLAALCSHDSKYLLCDNLISFPRTGLNHRWFY